MDYAQVALQCLEQAHQHSGEVKVEDYPLTMAVIGLGYAYLAAHTHQVKLAQFDELAYQQLMEGQQQVDGAEMMDRAKEVYEFARKSNEVVGPEWDKLTDAARYLWWQATHIAKTGQPSSATQ